MTRRKFFFVLFILSLVLLSPKVVGENIVGLDNHVESTCGKGQDCCLSVRAVRNTKFDSCSESFRSSNLAEEKLKNSGNNQFIDKQSIDDQNLNEFSPPYIAPEQKSEIFPPFDSAKEQSSHYIILFYPKEIRLPRKIVKRIITFRQRLISFAQNQSKNFTFENITWPTFSNLGLKIAPEQKPNHVEWDIDFDSLHDGSSKGKHKKNTGSTRRSRSSSKPLSPTTPIDQPATPSKDAKEPHFQQPTPSFKPEKKRRNRTSSNKPKTLEIKDSSKNSSDVDEEVVENFVPQSDIHFSENGIVGYTATSRPPSDDESGFLPVITQRRRNPSYNSTRSVVEYPDSVYSTYVTTPTLRRQHTSHLSLRSVEIPDQSSHSKKHDTVTSKRSFANDGLESPRGELSSAMSPRSRRQSIESWTNIANSHSDMPSSLIFTPMHRPPSPQNSVWGKSLSRPTSPAVNTEPSAIIYEEINSPVSEKDDQTKVERTSSGGKKYKGKPRKTKKPTPYKPEDNDDSGIAKDTDPVYVKETLSPQSLSSGPSSPQTTQTSETNAESTAVQSPYSPVWYSPFNSGFNPSNFSLRRGSDAASFESHLTNTSIPSVVINDEIRNILTPLQKQYFPPTSVSAFNQPTNFTDRMVDNMIQLNKRQQSNDPNFVPFPISDWPKVQLLPVGQQPEPMRRNYEMLTTLLQDEIPVSPSLLSPPAVTAPKRGFGLLPKRGKSLDQDPLSPVGLMPPSQSVVGSGPSSPSWQSPLAFLRGKAKEDDSSGQSVITSDDEARVAAMVLDDDGANSFPASGFLNRFGFLGGAKKKDRRSFVEADKPASGISDEVIHTPDDIVTLQSLQSQLPIVGEEREPGLLSRFMMSSTATKKQNQKDKEWQTQQQLLQQMQQQINLILQHQQLLWAQQQKSQSGDISSDFIIANNQLEVLKQQMVAAQRNGGFNVGSDSGISHTSGSTGLSRTSSANYSQSSTNSIFINNRQTTPNINFNNPASNLNFNQLPSNVALSNNQYPSNSHFNQSTPNVHFSEPSIVHFNQSTSTNLQPSLTVGNHSPLMSRTNSRNSSEYYRFPSQTEDAVDRMWDNLSSARSTHSDYPRSSSSRSVSPMSRISRGSRRSIPFDPHDQAYAIPSNTWNNAEPASAGGKWGTPPQQVDKNVSPPTSTASSTSSSIRRRLGFGNKRKDSKDSKEDDELPTPSSKPNNSETKMSTKVTREKSAAIKARITKLPASALPSRRADIQNAIATLTAKKMAVSYLATTDADDRLRDFWDERYLNEELELITHAIEDAKVKEEEQKEKGLFTLLTGFASKPKRASVALSPTVEADEGELIFIEDEGVRDKGRLKARLTLTKSMKPQK
ncbi:hypothetical protein HK096_000882 [Nowakowskiella sp. JEL0078]|nr:hypothetical protein HK096_000882 [Nowakowskiella sp. JEL0078]